MTIWFGESLEYQITGIRKISFEVDNKFHINNSALSSAETLMRNKSYVEIDCIAALSPDIYQLQTSAISSTPVNAKIQLDDLTFLYGTFFISHYSSRHSTGEIPEAHFTLKSSGEYHVRDS